MFLMVVHIDIEFTFQIYWWCCGIYNFYTSWFFDIEEINLNNRDHKKCLITLL